MHNTILPVRPVFRVLAMIMAIFGFEAEAVFGFQRDVGGAAGCTFVSFEFAATGITEYAQVRPKKTRP